MCEKISHDCNEEDIYRQKGGDVSDRHVMVSPARGGCDRDKSYIAMAGNGSGWHRRLAARLGVKYSHRRTGKLDKNQLEQ